MKVYKLFFLYGIKLLGKREYGSPSCWCQPFQLLVPTNPASCG